MKLLNGLLATAAIAAFSASTSHAAFTFSGSDDGGTGSATMAIEISGNIVTATLDNTSPITLDDGTGVNAPGITGFGFNLDPNALALASWSLTAYTTANPSVLVTIGSSATGSWDWILTTTMLGMNLDYLPQTDAGVGGALYNPLAVSGLASSPYYTEAILTLTFADGSEPTLDAFTGNGGCTQTDPCSPFVRFQNVGLNGEGSLRLPGTPGNGNGNGGGPGNGNGNGNNVPEPGTLALMGGALFGLWAVRRRKET